MASVHTTGLNWDQLSVVIATVVVAFVAILGSLSKGVTGLRKALHSEITRVTEALSSQIGGKLDMVGEHLKRQDGQLSDIKNGLDDVEVRVNHNSERISYLEGKNEPDPRKLRRRISDKPPPTIGE